jgi:hypothetical protein
MIPAGSGLEAYPARPWRIEAVSRVRAILGLGDSGPTESRRAARASFDGA